VHFTLPIRPRRQVPLGNVEYPTGLPNPATGAAYCVTDKL
jgi:hypothetical protein